MKDDHGFVLDVQGLVKKYGVKGGQRPVEAVVDMSFHLPYGGSVAIVGESGSGKTTVARLVVGLEEPTAGSIRVGGESVTVGGRRSRRLARARRVQMVFQDPYGSLDPAQEIGAGLDEVLRLHTSLGRRQRAERVAELAAQVGLGPRRLDERPGVLSGGERQRAAIARALAVEPELIVLDEAVASLDVSIQAQVLNLLADIRERTEIAYLLISHDLAVVRQLVDDVIVMRAGRVVERGTVNAVLDAPRHEYTRLLRNSVPRVTPC